MNNAGIHTGRGGLLQLNFIPTSAPTNPQSGQQVSSSSSSVNKKSATASFNRGSKMLNGDAMEINLDKSNILLLGPTGSGLCSHDIASVIPSLVITINDTFILSKKSKNSFLLIYLLCLLLFTFPWDWSSWAICSKGVLTQQRVYTNQSTTSWQLFYIQSKAICHEHAISSKKLKAVSKVSGRSFFLRFCLSQLISILNKRRLVSLIRTRATVGPGLSSVFWFEMLFHRVPSNWVRWSWQCWYRGLLQISISFSSVNLNHFVWATSRELLETAPCVWPKLSMQDSFLESNRFCRKHRKNHVFSRKIFV